MSSILNALFWKVIISTITLLTIISCIAVAVMSAFFTSAAILYKEGKRADNKWMCAAGIMLFILVGIITAIILMIVVQPKIV